MTEEKISISNTEWQVMEELWKGGRLTLMELVRAMEKKLGWAKSTTNTTVRRMEDKGLITHDEGEKAREYRPLLTRDEVAAAETEDFLSRVYGGSIGMLVASMAGQRGLSQEAIEELRHILTRAEEAEK